MGGPGLLVSGLNIRESLLVFKIRVGVLVSCETGRGEDKSSSCFELGMGSMLMFDDVGIEFGVPEGRVECLLQSLWILSFRCLLFQICCY